jgi:hypothetical protein
MSSPLLHSSAVQRVGLKFDPQKHRDRVVFQSIAHNFVRIVLTGAALGLLPGAMAMAQPSTDEPVPNPRNRPSLDSYSLPPGPSSPSRQGALQGPVEAEIPIAEPAPAAPQPAPQRTTPTERAAPSDSPAASAPTASPRTVQAQQPVKQSPPLPSTQEKTPTSETGPAVVESAAAPDESPERTEAPSDSNSSPAKIRPASAATTTDWYLLLVAALFFVLLGAMLFWRARRAARKQSAFTANEDMQVGSIEPVAKLPEPIPSVPVLEIGFRPHSANATLFNAALGFELTLSNRGDEILSGINIQGAMGQAGEHGARAPLLTDLSAFGEIAALQTGETEMVTGEFRIPLTSIQPIMFRSQALFVPLIQFSIEFTDATGFQHFQTATYLVGREHQPPRPKMAPFRLDLGPRSFAPLGQRPLATG